MNTTVITVAEADVFLGQQAAWLGLDNAAKKAFIARGCVYAQTQWTCVDEVVWEGAEMDIPDELKEAVAYYAYADSGGNLYGDPASPEARHGGLRSVSSKLGELADETQYFQGGAQTGVGNMSATGYADALMKVYCELAATSGSVPLVRV